MTAKQYIELHNQIKPYIHKTPVLSSEKLNEIAGCQLFFKCENFQKMGAFKMRGAVNAMLNLNQIDRAKGVVTHSSGNFAQAVALAAKLLEVKAYIVMPSTAPQVKIDAVKSYGGEVIICEPTLEARERNADKIVREKGATLLHPSNDLPVIYGQGTAAIELIQEHTDLDSIITPVGGGGLLAGTALAMHLFSPQTRVYAGEPENCDDAYRSFKSGKIESNESTNTVADGLKTMLGDNNFPIIQEHVTDIFTVSEKEIVEAMQLMWTRLKIVCEASSAVALAAVLKQKAVFKAQKVGLIVSGGNVDLEKLPFGEPH